MDSYGDGLQKNDTHCAAVVFVLQTGAKCDPRIDLGQKLATLLVSHGSPGFERRQQWAQRRELRFFND
jgi:hypothetical protein